jgi:GT2 family glycosyltransferase
MKRAARRLRVEILSARSRWAGWQIRQLKTANSLPRVYRLFFALYFLKRLLQEIARLRRWPSLAFWPPFLREMETNFLLRLLVWRDWPVREPINLYQTFRQNNLLVDAERRAMRSQVESWPDRPLVSVVVPVYNARPEWIDRLVTSLMEQTYDRWELVLADDGSHDEQTRLALQASAERDERISLHFLDANQGVVHATNHAVDRAHGSWIAFADHDDELMPDALWWIARAIVEDPAVEVLYTDEEIYHDATGDSYPHIKPGFSPQQLQAYNYICHLLVVRRDLFDKVGRLRPGTDGAQDFDLVLRLAEQTDRFVGIPRILYRWHVVPQSMSRYTDPKTALPQQNDRIDETTRRVVQDHFDRMGSSAQATLVGHWIRPTFPPTDLGEVTIIICTKDQPKRLARCVASIEERTDYPQYRILLVDNGSQRPETLTLLEELGRRHRVVRIESGPEGFNFSRLNNQGARLADSPMVLFLNDDTVVLERGWLSAMVGTLHLPGVEVVGARLLYPHRLNQHAGLILGALGWGPWHALIGLPADTPAYGGYLTFPHNCIAVTGACLLTRRPLFLEMGGFHEEDLAVSFNDVDFCLRVHQRGGRIAYAPQAELIHDEGVSRGRFAWPREVLAMKRRGYGVADPYWNPQFARTTPHLCLSRRRQLRGLRVVPCPRVLYVPPRNGSAEIGPILESLVLDGKIEILPIDSADSFWPEADLLFVEGIEPTETNRVIERAARRGIPILWALPQRLLLPVHGSAADRADLLRVVESFRHVYQVVFSDPYSIGWAAAGLPHPNLELVARTLEVEPEDWIGDPQGRSAARRRWGLGSDDVCFWAPVSANDLGTIRFLIGVFASLPESDRARVRLIIETDEDLPSSAFLPIRRWLREEVVPVSVVGPGEEHLLAADVVLAHELVEPRPERVMRGLLHALPVIGTGLVESGDLIHRPATGRVARAFDRSDWRGAILELAGDSSLRERLGAGGRDWLTSRETRRDALGHWQNLIEEAAELSLRRPIQAVGGPLEKIPPHSAVLNELAPKDSP